MLLNKLGSHNFDFCINWGVAGYTPKSCLMHIIDFFKLESHKNNKSQANRCVETYTHPAGIYLHKVNNRSHRTRCEICSKLTIKKPERRYWCRSGIFMVNFEHISHLVLVFLLLTLNKNA